MLHFSTIQAQTPVPIAKAVALPRTVTEDASLTVASDFWATIAIAASRTVAADASQAVAVSDSVAIAAGASVAMWPLGTLRRTIGAAAPGVSNIDFVMSVPRIRAIEMYWRRCAKRTRRYPGQLLFDLGGCALNMSGRRNRFGGFPLESATGRKGALCHYSLHLLW